MLSWFPENIEKSFYLRALSEGFLCVHRCNRQSRENNLSFLHSFIQFCGMVIKIVEISYTHKDHTCVKGTDDGREKKDTEE